MKISHIQNLSILSPWILFWWGNTARIHYGQGQSITCLEENARNMNLKQDLRNNYLKILQGGHVETITREKKVHIVPRNFKQDELLGLLTDQSKPIVFTT